MSKGTYVLVTTEYRGVFFGQIVDEDNLPGEITLGKARNCLSWGADVGGFLGLAVKGPTKCCVVGLEVAETRLFKITSVTPVSEEAIRAWKSMEWKEASMSG